MKYKSFISKLQKRLGTKDLDMNSSEWGVNGRKEWLVYEGTVASWRVEPIDFRDPDSPRCVTGFHTKGVGQESDPHTDYFPGTYWNNATQLIDRLKSPPAKYPAGSLVRGKDNKRAKRFGYAGKHALVTKADDARYLTLQFVGELPADYNNCYPARDFELVS
tara:strand:- start:1479 stop:1964 length:486 start_codon:yes stop_codon:yes gene_type:complete